MHIVNKPICTNNAYLIEGEKGTGIYKGIIKEKSKI